MKRLFKYFLLTFLLVSCTKEKLCYTCQVGNVHQDYCGDIKDYHPKNAQGIELQYFCVPK